MTDKRDIANKHPQASDAGIGLEEFFSAARYAAPEPDMAFLGRVAMAADELAARVPVRAVASEASGLWRAVVNMLGGWGGIGSMAVAAAAGVWIGLAGIPGVQGTASASVGSGDGATYIGSALFADGDILALAVE